MQPNDNGGLVVISLFSAIFIPAMAAKILHLTLEYIGNTLLLTYGFEFGVVLFIVFVIVLNLWIFYRCCFLMQRSKTHA